MKKRKKSKKPIVIFDDDDSSSQEEEEKKILPKNFFEDVPVEYELANAEDFVEERYRDAMEKIGTRIANLPLKPVNILSNQHSLPQFKYKTNSRRMSFEFKTNLMRVLVRNLYLHQKVGLNFLYQAVVKRPINGVILADYMGLGKSIQVISLINVLALDEKEKRPTLLVCPKIVITHWLSEFQKFNQWVKYDEIVVEEFEPINPYIIESGNIDDRIKTVKTWYQNKGVLVINYQKLVRLWKLGYTEMNARLFSKKNLLILDEGHKLRTDKMVSKTSMALSQAKSKRRIILTGYPLQNNLVEYWHLINYIKPGFLGDKKSFINNFAKKINLTISESEELNSKKYIYSRAIGKILHNQLSPYILRRGKDLLSKALAIQKREIVIYSKLTKIQVFMYNKTLQFLKEKKKDSFCRVLFWVYSFLTLIMNHPQIARNYISSKIKQLKIQEHLMEDEEENNNSNNNSEEEQNLMILEIEDFQTLQKIFEGFENPSIPIPKNSENSENSENIQVFSESSKMEVLIHLIFGSKKIGDKVVVFTKSIQTLAFIESLLVESKSPKISFGRLDGSMNLKNRQKVISLFNTSSEYDVLIVSTLSCCEGVNLHAANRVILFDLNWNPSHDVEAISRIYRFGQTKNCSIYRIISYNSIEHKIQMRQLRKMKLLGLIVDDKNLSLDLSLMIRENEMLKELGNFEIYNSTIPQFSCEEIILKGSENFEKDELLISLIPLFQNSLVSIHSQESLLSQNKKNEKNENIMKDENVDFNDQLSQKEMDKLLFDFKQNGVFNVTNNNLDSDSDDVFEEEEQEEQEEDEIEILQQNNSKSQNNSNKFRNSKKKFKNESFENEENKVIFDSVHNKKSKKKKLKKKKSKKKKKKSSGIVPRLKLEIPEKKLIPIPILFPLSNISNSFSTSTSSEIRNGNQKIGKYYENDEKKRLRDYSLSVRSRIQNQIRSQSSPNPISASASPSIGSKTSPTFQNEEFSRIAISPNEFGKDWIEKITKSTAAKNDKISTRKKQEIRKRVGQEFERNFAEGGYFSRLDGKGMYYKKTNQVAANFYAKIAMKKEKNKINQIVQNKQIIQKKQTRSNYNSNKFGWNDRSNVKRLKMKKKEKTIRNNYNINNNSEMLPPPKLDDFNSNKNLGEQIRKGEFQNNKIGKFSNSNKQSKKKNRNRNWNRNRNRNRRRRNINRNQNYPNTDPHPNFMESRRGEISKIDNNSSSNFRISSNRNNFKRGERRGRSLDRSGNGNVRFRSGLKRGRDLDEEFKNYHDRKKRKT